MIFFFFFWTFWTRNVKVENKPFPTKKKPITLILFLGAEIQWKWNKDQSSGPTSKGNSNDEMKLPIIVFHFNYCFSIFLFFKLSTRKVLFFLPPIVQAYSNPQGPLSSLMQCFVRILCFLSFFFEQIIWMPSNTRVTTEFTRAYNTNKWEICCKK